MEPETFCVKLRRIRKEKLDDFGRALSQEKAARIFNVSLSTWRAWEHEPPRHLPDSRSRDMLESLWPELFNR